MVDEFQVLRDRIVHECPFLYKNGIYLFCGSGWLPIIYELSKQLEMLILKYIEDGYDTEFTPFCSQVKEKYGTLRFYMNSATQEMCELIENAEKKSTVTCERCGKPGKLNNGPYYSTYCPEHMN